MPTPTNPSNLPNYDRPIANAELSISQQIVEGQQADERWQRLFDQLRAWELDPDSLADDENDPPSKKIVQLAAKLALTLKKDGALCPDSVVADPSGGIVFEYGPRDAAVAFHVWDDGTIERLAFQGSKLVDRRPVSGN